MYQFDKGIFVRIIRDANVARHPRPPPRAKVDPPFPLHCSLEIWSAATISEAFVTYRDVETTVLVHHDVKKWSSSAKLTQKNRNEFKWVNETGLQKLQHPTI